MAAGKIRESRHQMGGTIEIRRSLQGVKYLAGPETNNRQHGNRPGRGGVLNAELKEAYDNHNGSGATARCAAREKGGEWPDNQRRRGFRGGCEVGSNSFAAAEKVGREKTGRAGRIGGRGGTTVTS